MNTTKLSRAIPIYIFLLVILGIVFATHSMNVSTFKVGSTTITSGTWIKGGEYNSEYNFTIARVAGTHEIDSINITVPLNSSSDPMFDVNESQIYTSNSSWPCYVANTIPRITKRKI